MLGLLVSGGEYDPPANLRELRACAALVVGADQGAAHALRMGLPVHVAVGDFDSIDEATMALLTAGGTELRPHRQDKDETDSELGLRVLMEAGCDEIAILCAFGGRLDHELANVLLLDVPGLAEIATLISGDTSVRLVRCRVAIDGGAGDLVTLLPLGQDAEGIRTEGLAYPLKGERLLAGYARGVSNVMEGDRAEVSLTAGKLLVIHIRSSHGKEEE